MKDDCLFCNIAKGKIPSATIYEDSHFRVILDVNPATKGHCLIIPKEHFDNIYDLDAETAGKLFSLATCIARAVRDALGCDGLNIVQNNGEIAGRRSCISICISFRDMRTMAYIWHGRRMNRKKRSWKRSAQPSEKRYKIHKDRRKEKGMGKIDFKPGNMLYPLPAVLVTVRDTDGRDNMLTIAWVGTVCTNPPMLYISVRPERYSYHMLEESGQFVVNLTTAAMAKAVDYCGVRSGKEVDKFRETGLIKGEAVKVNAPVIEDSRST